ncbi:7215_t:CDS:1, partial [Acaulospora morrowiae]
SWSQIIEELIVNESKEFTRTYRSETTRELPTNVNTRPIPTNIYIYIDDSNAEIETSGQKNNMEKE